MVKNKTGYTASPVASRTADRQGPYVRSLDQLAKDREKINTQKKRFFKLKKKKEWRKEKAKKLYANQN